MLLFFLRALLNYGFHAREQLQNPGPADINRSEAFEDEDRWTMYRFCFSIWNESGPVFCSLRVLRDLTSLCLPKIGQGEFLRFHSLRDCVLFPWRPSENNREYIIILYYANIIIYIKFTHASSTRSTSKKELDVNLVSV